MIANYHTHTHRCRHATGSEEEYVLNAIEAGLKVLGFSDHTPFLFPGDYYSTMRMFPHQLEDYVTTVLALKEKYKDRIQIRLGLEVEYYPDRMDDLLNLVAPYPIEYFVLGQHWCGNEENEPYNGCITDDEARWKRYCAQTVEGIKTGLFTYLAHPDIMKFTGDPKLFRQGAETLCQGAKEADLPMEINLLGIRTCRQYPNEQFWEIVGEMGCKVVLGCDAHTPQDVTDPASEEKALELVQKYKLQLLEQIPLRSFK